MGRRRYGSRAGVEGRQGHAAWATWARQGLWSNPTTCTAPGHRAYWQMHPPGRPTDRVAPTCGPPSQVHTSVPAACSCCGVRVRAPTCDCEAEAALPGPCCTPSPLPRSAPARGGSIRADASASSGGSDSHARSAVADSSSAASGSSRSCGSGSSTSRQTHACSSSGGPSSAAPSARRCSGGGIIASVVCRRRPAASSSALPPPAAAASSAGTSATPGAAAPPASSSRPRSATLCRSPTTAAGQPGPSAATACASTRSLRHSSRSPCTLDSAEADRSFAVGRSSDASGTSCASSSSGARSAMPSARGTTLLAASASASASGSEPAGGASADARQPASVRREDDACFASSSRALGQAHTSCVSRLAAGPPGCWVGAAPPSLLGAPGSGSGSGSPGLRWRCWGAGVAASCCWPAKPRSAPGCACKGSRDGCTSGRVRGLPLVVVRAMRRR